MATGGATLYNQATQLLPGIRARRFRQLKFEDGSIVPTMGDLQAGAQEVLATLIQEIGQAEFSADGSLNFPIVDINASEDRYPVVMIGAAFSVTLAQERALELNPNRQLIDNKRMMTPRKSIAERVNRYTAFGRSVTGLRGFINNANVIVNNTSTNLYALTPQQLIDFFMDEQLAVLKNSNTVEDSGDMVVSLDIHRLLAKTLLSSTQTSVLSHLLNNVGGVFRSITWATEAGFAELEANGVLAGGTNKDRIVIYPIDPDVVERHVELVQMAPMDYIEVKDGRRIFPMFQCVTPTIINYPGAFRYINVPKKA